jgi:hypothetical protein
MFRVEEVGCKVGSLGGMMLDQFFEFCDPVSKLPIGQSDVECETIRALLTYRHRSYLEGGWGLCRWRRCLGFY